MNIVIVNDTAHINGGAAKLAIAEATGLADRGHHVEFLAAVGPVTQELTGHPNIRVTCTAQFDLLSDPNKFRAFLQGWWNFKAAAAVKQILHHLDRSSSAVHLHVWSRALSSSVVRAAIDEGFPVVCTLHDFMVACPTGTFFHHGDEAICKRKPLSAACVTCNCDTRSYAQKLWRVGRQIIQENVGQIPSHVTDYIVHSELARAVMAGHLPAGARMHSLEPYIETSAMAPARPDENEGFAFLGRFVREKGVMMLARSAAAEGIATTFIGSGPLEPDIRATYPAARITGWVGGAESLNYLRRSRALVFPSLWYETLGLVVLEAAAHGIPSIVSSDSAAREYVLDGVTGLHFKGGDEEDLRAKLRQMNDPELAAKLGAEAYERFWGGNFHSLTAHVASLESIYKKLVKQAHFLLSSNLVLPRGVS